MQRAKQVFIGAWLLLCMLKLVLAARLPLFVDEAFYWQEGRHLAWAYSDLPGLTAWLARLGVAMGGDHPLALRLPFLLLGAWMPWLVVRMTAREFDVEAGWRAGLLALLLPLAGLLAAALMALGIHGRSVKEAQAGSSLVVLAVSLLPIIPMLSTRGEQPWQLWLPVVAQSTLMGRVLRGEAIEALEVLLPALMCAALTVVALALVVRQMGRVVAR